LGIAGEIGREKLERHDSVEPGVLGFVDLSHAALADFLEDPVMGDRFAGEHHGTVWAVADVGDNGKRTGIRASTVSFCIGVLPPCENKQPRGERNAVVPALGAKHAPLGRDKS